MGNRTIAAKQKTIEAAIFTVDEELQPKKHPVPRGEISLRVLFHNSFKDHNPL